VNTLSVFGLLALAALLFYGGQLVRRRRGGRISFFDDHPRVAVAAALVAILVLLGLGVAAISAILLNPS
jgi:hypothetical protein